VELIKRFTPEQFERALESWAWLDLSGKTPRLASAFGDVFLEGGGAFWFLDSVEGTLTRTWETGDQLQSQLNTPEGQDRYLLAGLAAAADRAGLVLGTDQVYDFTVPPILGGQFATDNLKVMDFVIALHLSGQLLQQVKEMPPGARVSGFRLEEP
jgi:hypothetical protein